MKEIITKENTALPLFLTSPEVFVYEVPDKNYFHMFLHTLLFQNKHILDPKQACNFIHVFSNFEKI